MTRSSRLRGALLCGAVLLATLAMRPTASITVWMAGDSTMAPKTPTKRPETGWGEAFAECFSPNTVRVANRAMNGRSTKSFVAEGHWAAIVDSLQPGDYVFIQFGHNDEKVNTDRGATPEVYASNLARLVDDVRAKRGIPVLITPVTRRSFRGDTLIDSHREYPPAMRRVAIEKGVALIDMHRSSMALVARLGADSSLALWLHLEPGAHPNYPAGVRDDTHFNAAGARAMAGLAIDAIRELRLELGDHLHGCATRP